MKAGHVKMTKQEDQWAEPKRMCLWIRVEFPELKRGGYKQGTTIQGGHGEMSKRRELVRRIKEDGLAERIGWKDEAGMTGRQDQNSGSWVSAALKLLQSNSKST